jgi:hypothetical protein
LNEFGECVAVAQAINKLNENDDDIISFSSKDEEVCVKHDHVLLFKDHHDLYVRPNLFAN